MILIYFTLKKFRIVSKYVCLEKKKREMHFVLDSNTKTKPRPYLLEATLHKRTHFPQMTVCHSVKNHITVSVMNHGSQLAI